MDNCCENCVHAMFVADIDGLIDCEPDGRSRDCDMVCDDYKKRAGEEEVNGRQMCMLRRNCS